MSVIGAAHVAFFRSRYKLAFMRIWVNGEPRDLQAPWTVRELLTTLGIGDGPVAVERNGHIVPRAEHGAAALQEGDRVEIVQFVGGG
jgi:sulfur carrier protein